MSSTIKRQNHRIHPCNADQKKALAQFLIQNHAGKNILIVTSTNAEELTDLVSANTITLLNDEQLSKAPDLRSDVLISYDLPEKAILYMSRFARANEYALILLDSEDQKRLYPIELLNGRTIVQEVIKGFEPNFGIAVENVQKAQLQAEKEARKEYFAIQDAKKKESRQKRDTRPERNRDDAPRGERRPARSENDDFSAKKQQNTKPRFIGKDENGKPIFEGKTRERNHYIDGTPRTEEEKRSRSKFDSKPKFFGDKAKSSDDRNPSDREKKPYGERKPYDKEKKPFGDKKPYGEKKPFGDKKPYGDKPAFGEKKPYDKDGKKPYGDKKSYGEKKPFDKDKKPYGEKKPYQDRKPSDAPATPKRPPRRIDVKSFKSPKESE